MMKKIIYLRHIGLIILLSVASLSFSQNNLQIPANDGWTLLKSTTNAEVFVKVTECQGESFYLFKVINLSSEVISFKMTADIENEPAYGPFTFDVKLSGYSESDSRCEHSIYKLSNQMEVAPELINSIKITLNQ